MKNLFFIFKPKFLKALYQSLRSEKKAIILIVILSLVMSVVQIAGLSAFLPVIVILEGNSYSGIADVPLAGRLIQYLPSDPDQAVFPLLAIVFCLIVIRAILRAIIFIVQARIKNRVDGYWQKKVLNHWLAMPPLYHSRENRSHIMHLCAQEIATIGRAGASSIMFISAAIQIAVVIVYMLLISWQVVAYISGFIFFVTLPLSIVIRNIFEASQRDSSMALTYTGRIFEVIKRVDLIDIFSNYKNEIKNLNKYLTDFLAARIDLQKARAAGPLTIEILGAVLICLIVLYFYNQQAGDSFQQLVLFIGSLIIVQPQVTKINDAVGQLVRVNAAMNQVNKLLEVPQRDVNRDQVNAQKPNSYNLRLENVNFAYNHNTENELKVLDDVSVEIPQGKLTMLFGASGTGKTTFLNILLRLFAPDSGKIILGGMDSATFTPAVWSKMVLLTPQDNIIFDGTIRENIIYGIDRDLSFEELSRATKQTEAFDFIQRMPKGFDSYVGNNGDLLSGGQRQRLALARIFASNPDVFLLDEPTSSLDRFTENDVMKQIRELGDSGKTIIMSTHKIELAPFAGHLLWFEDGKVFEGMFDDFKEHLSRLEYSIS